MKKLLYIVILIACTYVGYWCGCQTWFMDINYKPHHFNTEEARLHELKYCNSILKGLHYFYQRDKAFWTDSFMQTKEYKNIEEINQKEWEDFYCDW